MKTVGIYSSFNYEECDVERPIFDKAGVAMRVCKTIEEYKTMLPTIDALIVSNHPVTAEDIARMGKCKAILRQGTVVDHIDIEAATAKKIAVCNTPGYNIHDAAEHALSAVMMLVRNWPLYDQEIKVNKNWHYRALPIMKRFCDITLGIVGFGKIGQMLAIKARSIIGHIQAYDPYMDKKRAEELGVTPMDLGDLLSTSDVISLHVPLTEKTYHLLGKVAMTRLKKGAYVVNAARGGLLDEDALIEAIDRGDVTGAALDLREDGDWPDLSRPIYNHPRVINTPHCAWYTKEALDASRLVCAMQVLDVFEGRKPVGKLN